MADALKLSTGISPACADFMAEYHASTSSNPMSPRMRIFGMTAGIEVRAFDGGIRLISIQSIRRRSGFGSAALDWLVSLARKHGVVISGHAKATGVGLATDQLRQWYSRHGFRVDPGGDFVLSEKRPFGGSGLGQGRKPITDGEPSVMLTARVSRAQKAKFEALGGAAWLREAIEKAELTA